MDTVSSRTPENALEVHIIAESGTDNAVDMLRQATGLSRTKIKHAMLQGAAWITRGSNTQRLRRAKRKLRVGDEIHLYYDADILNEVPPAPTLVHDAGGYSVWNKPCGLYSQGSKWGDHCTVVRWAERNLQPERPAFTVHRLDRAANGLMLIAHSKGMAAKLATLFRERRIEKRYRALVHGEFPNQPELLRVTEALDGKEAISEFSLLDVVDNGSRSVVDVRIETGRKHQVRRHLANIGHPIVGDRLYGSGASDGLDLQLRAYRLAFECPLSQQLVEYLV